MYWPFGLLLADVLMAGVILSVQLVVYPGFRYFSKEGLSQWHRIYTRNITVLVAPLMIIQLLGGIFWTIGQPHLFSILYTLGVLSLWAITFRYFLPLHRRIERGKADKNTFKTLVRLNWIRTVLWLFVLAIHLMAEADTANEILSTLL